MLFVVWNFFSPSIQLVQQASVSNEVRHSPENAPSSKLQSRAAANSLQFQVTLPAKWLKVHQPLNVWIRQTAYFILITSVVLISSTSMFNPNSDWLGVPARMLWGEHHSGSASPLRTQSNKSMLRLQKSKISPKTS
jgi:hypothetical protein